MPVIHYPFIDIAVHEQVRGRFAAGDAVVIFSADVGSVLWSNGRGARLFGYDSVYDLLDQGPRPQNLILRQIEAAGRRLTETGDTASLTLRVVSGFQSVPVTATCRLVEIGGEQALLLTVPMERGTVSPGRAAAAILQGLDDLDTHIAVLDAEGGVIASSQHFDTLGLTPQTARMLVTMAGSDLSRLVKRPVSTAKGYLPTALGKLSDEPSLHLLLIVEASPAGMDVAPAQDPGEPTPQVEDVPDSPASTEASFSEALDAIASIEETTEPQDTIVVDINVPEDDREEQPCVPTEAEEIDLSPEVSLPVKIEPDEEPRDAAVERVEPLPSAASMPAAAAGFVFQRDMRAMRFVWKIDAEGRFSEVSDEFPATVGPHAAAINGMAFDDVADLFNLDPEKKIRQLLGRRDTWSGKTIWWPVEGTSLIVPIDLAALPTYTRDRIFDGFRGFGIVRVGDAADDPHAIGMTFSRNSEFGNAEIGDIETENETVIEAIAPVTDTPSEAGQSTAADDDAPAAEDARQEDAITEINPDTTASDENLASAAERPEGERPALRIVTGPTPDGSEKVVQLPGRAHRGEGLTPVERAAFREIARQLDRFVGPGREVDENSGQEMPSVAVDQPAEQPEILPVAHDDEPAGATTLHEAASFEPGAEGGPVTSDVASEDAMPLPADAPESSGAGGSSAADEDGNASSPENRDYPTNGIPMRERMGLSADILDQMPVALLVHNGDTLLHGNPEFLRLTGYSSIEALAEVGGLDALLQRPELDTSDERASGMVVVRADDDLVPVTARLQSVRFDEATALMLALMPTAGDTAPDNAENESEAAPLPASQLPEHAAQVEVEELRAILETATDGVVIIGIDGHIRSMNRSASALFNYDSDEATGKPFVMLFAHESQKAIIDYLGGLSGHGVASVLNDGREVIGREASGGFIPLFMTIGTLTSSNGYCAVIRDITQWKRTEEELRAAKRSAETANAHKSEFLAHVSHEIRTPLNAIIGFADLMASERFGSVGHPRYVEYANDIVRSGRHVLDIVNDLLDISKIEAGEMELDFESVELNETVSEAVSFVQPQANSQRVIIRTALSHAVPPVVADLRSVKQIVLNILSNAIRFTPSGGQIVVSTAYEANGSVVLRIRDTGIGMTRAELELAMKPFRQVAGSGRKRGDGTGLGLPLTKAMVDANRAAFSINSAPREGTLVEITFPPQRVLAT